jgi:two-component system nitrogen regulation response regulator GlnG
MDNIMDLIDNSFYAADADRIYGSMIDRIEKLVIAKALEQTCGNQVEAAKLLGLHRNTLHNKIKKFDIDIWRFKK